MKQYLASALLAVGLAFSASHFAQAETRCVAMCDVEGRQDRQVSGSISEMRSQCQSYAAQDAQDYENKWHRGYGPFSWKLYTDSSVWNGALLFDMTKACGQPNQ